MKVSKKERDVIMKSRCIFTKVILSLWRVGLSRLRMEPGKYSERNQTIIGER